MEMNTEETMKNWGNKQILK